MMQLSNFKPSGETTAQAEKMGYQSSTFYHHEFHARLAPSPQS